MRFEEALDEEKYLEVQPGTMSSIKHIGKIRALVKGVGYNSFIEKRIKKNAHR